MTADPGNRGSQPPPIPEITGWNEGERIVWVNVYLEWMCTLCVLWPRWRSIKVAVWCVYACHRWPHRQPRHFNIYIPRLSLRGLHSLTILTKYSLLIFLLLFKCGFVWPWEYSFPWQLTVYKSSSFSDGVMTLSVRDYVLPSAIWETCGRIPNSPMVLTERRKGPAFDRWKHVPDSCGGLHIYIRSPVPLDRTNCFSRWLFFLTPPSPWYVLTTLSYFKGGT